MNKVAVAQKEADNFRAALENAPGLGVRAEPQAADRFVDASTSFPAHLRARIQDTRNRANAHSGSPRHIPNGGLFWNCFHARADFRHLSHFPLTRMEP